MKKYQFGEKLRLVRKRRGFTLKHVADRARVSESLVSQIERDKVSPAIETLLALADVLDIDTDYLFRDLRKPRAVHIVRRAERDTIHRQGARFERLSRIPEEREKHEIEAYYLELPPGGETGNASYGHQGKELGTILSGRGELEIGNETIALAPGDSVSFASAVPHTLKNCGTRPLKAYWIMTPPKLFTDEG